MGSPRKNYSGNFQHAKDQFQNAARQLFAKEHYGWKCNNAIFVNRKSEVDVRNLSQTLRDRNELSTNARMSDLHEYTQTDFAIVGFCLSVSM